MTAGRGLLFDEGPSACPFVALDRDRERRADEPDSRHRCYATPTPEPRALAHQRNFCLTPGFSGCPIFQDWAIRAAARPVPLRPVPPALALIEEERPVGEPELVAVDEPAGNDEGASVEQVGMFDEKAAKPAVLPAAPPMPTFRLTASDGRDDDEAGPRNAPPPPIIPPPSRPLSGRSTGGREPILAPKPPAPPKPTPSKPIKTKPTLRREDIVPSWERSHYDVPDPDRRPRRRGAMSRLVLVFVGLAVFAIAVVVALMLPVLLRNGAPASPSPTFAAAGTPSPTAAPTLTPTPEQSWQTYTIKLGDNLFRIATQFNITYEQLLAANPQITNPDYIRAGDVINIPPPNFPASSPSGGPSAPASPSATP